MILKIKKKVFFDLLLKNKQVISKSFLIESFHILKKDLNIEYTEVLQKKIRSSFISLSSRWNIVKRKSIRSKFLEKLNQEYFEFYIIPKADLTMMDVDEIETNNDHDFKIKNHLEKSFKRMNINK